MSSRRGPPLREIASWRRPRSSRQARGRRRSAPSSPRASPPTCVSAGPGLEPAVGGEDEGLAGAAARPRDGPAANRPRRRAPRRHRAAPARPRVTWIAGGWPAVARLKRQRSPSRRSRTSTAVAKSLRLRPSSSISFSCASSSARLVDLPGQAAHRVAQRHRDAGRGAALAGDVADHDPAAVRRWGGCRRGRRRSPSPRRRGRRRRRCRGPAT